MRHCSDCTSLGPATSAVSGVSDYMRWAVWRMAACSGATLVNSQTYWDAASQRPRRPPTPHPQAHGCVHPVVHQHLHFLTFHSNAGVMSHCMSAAHRTHVQPCSFACAATGLDSGILHVLAWHGRAWRYAVRTHHDILSHAFAAVHRVVYHRQNAPCVFMPIAALSHTVGATRMPYARMHKTCAAKSESAGHTRSERMETGNTCSACT